MPGDPQRHRELDDEEVHRVDAGQDADEDERPVAQGTEARLALGPRWRRRQVGQAGEDHGGDEEGRAVEGEDGEVGPGLVDRQREAAEERADRDADVGDRTQVGLEPDAPATGGDAGDVAGADRARAPVEERLDGEDEDQAGEGPGGEQPERGHPRESSESHQHLARTAGVAEMAEWDLAEEGDRGGHGEGGPDLRGGEADDVGEVEGRGGQQGAVAHGVDEGGDGEDAECGVDRDAPPGEAVGPVRRRHGPRIYLDVKIISGAPDLPRRVEPDTPRGRNSRRRIAAKALREGVAKA